MKKFFRCMLITVAYWLLVVFGPALIMLWNALSPAMARYEKGDLGYAIIVTVAPALSCLLARSAALKLSDEKHDICVLVNHIVCAVAMAVFFIFASGITEHVQWALAAVACVGCAYSQTKSIEAKLKQTQEVHYGSDA